MEYIIKFTEQEAQIVLDCLIKEPYGKVVDLINSIQSQAIEQKQKKKND